MASFSDSPLSSPGPRKRRSKGWASKCERCCCSVVTCLPLVFVYGLTTWAIWVEAGIGFLPGSSTWGGTVNFAHYVILRPADVKDLQDISRRLLASYFTSYSTGPILPQYGLIPGHLSTRQEALATPPYLPTNLVRNKTCLLSPSNRPAGLGSVRNVKRASPIVRITARAANAVFSRWTTIARGLPLALG